MELVNSQFQLGYEQAAKPAHADFASRELRPIILVVAFCLFLTMHASARTRPAKTHAAPDNDYVSALAAANRFLQAWQTHDEETAVLLLTNGAKRNCSEERLDAFFSADPQTAYEISRGRKLQTGRYSFPLTIFEASPSGRPARPRYTDLIVSRTGHGDWAIDKLP
jgi:hypothetical protein